MLAGVLPCGRLAPVRRESCREQGGANRQGTVVSRPSLQPLDVLVAALDVRRPAVAAHSRRVSTFAVRLAAQYGLPPEAIETIRLGALLHDVGKILVPVRILTKPGRLTEREWQQLRSHSEIGAELGRDHDVAEAVRDIILHHHEWYDGTGYPDCLEGASIAWPVRIVSVMDAFDALTSPRAYRAALSIEAARSHIARDARNRFDPWVVSGLLSLPRPLLEAASTPVTPYFPDGCPDHASLAATKMWTPRLR